jgi:hypothetical protein
MISYLTHLTKINMLACVNLENVISQITVSMYLLVDRIKIPQIEKKKVLNYISVFKSLKKTKTLFYK